MDDCAKKIAEKAKEMSKNDDHEHTPYVHHGRKFGKEVTGGKDNDITIILSMVTEKTILRTKKDDEKREFFGTKKPMGKRNKKKLKGEST